MTLIELFWTLVLLEYGTQGLSRKSLLGRYLGLMGTTRTVALGTGSASAEQVSGVIEGRLGWRSQVSPIYWDTTETWSQPRAKGSWVQA